MYIMWKKRAAHTSLLFASFAPTPCGLHSNSSLMPVVASYCLSAFSMASSLSLLTAKMRSCQEYRDRATNDAGKVLQTMWE